MFEAEQIARGFPSQSNNEKKEALVQGMVNDVHQLNRIT